MTFMRMACALFLAMLLPTVAAMAQDNANKKVANLATTPDGVEYGTFGDAPAKPAPALVVLSGNIEDSFANPAFLKAGRYLVPKGYLAISVDLPCHGKFETPDYSGLVGWGKLGAEGKDFVAGFNERLKKVLDHLVAQKQIDPEKIVITGTSRGGFLALRYAAFDKRVRAAVSYCGVSDLRRLKEFAVAKDVKSVDDMSLLAHIDELLGRPVFYVIGDRDARVGTDAAVDFMTKLAAAAQKANVPSQTDLHVVSEPRGHPLPVTVDADAARWIFRTIEGRELPGD